MSSNPAGMRDLTHKKNMSEFRIQKEEVNYVLGTMLGMLSTHTYEKV